MSSDKSPTIQTEKNVIDTKPRRRGCIGHCLKFWWAYLIAFIAVVVLVVCLVIFVGIPKIAQSKLDHAELSIEGISVSNTESGRLVMAINSTIRSDGKVHANIDPFLGVMYLEDLEGHTPFASINFPATTSDALQTVNISQTLDVTNQEALTTFNTWLLKEEKLRVTVLGDTKVQVKGISKKFPVTFKKTIEMPGLRLFEGLTVTDTVVELPADARGNNFKGTVNIPNYSFFTIEIGNASFTTYLFNKDVGVTYIDNLILRPGMENKYPMRATVDTGATIGALESPDYCQGPSRGVLPFQLSGKEVINHGESIKYFSDALGAANQTVSIDLGTPVAKLLGKPVECKAEGSH